MSTCEDVELENLRMAALKSMHSKASNKPAIGNSVSKSSISNFSNNISKSNNVHIQIERPNTDRNFSNNKKFRKNFPKNHQQQFNQQSQFHNPQFNNQSQFSNPKQFNNQPQFNNPPPHQQYANTPVNFANDLQQYFNQFDNVQPQFNKQFNEANSPQSAQFTNHHFNSNLPQPPQFKNHSLQFQQPQFNAPRSNLIVLTAENSSKDVMNDSISNYTPHHQMNLPPHFRNGYNKSMNRHQNKKFHNKQFHQGKSNEIKPMKDVPTDVNKNTDSLPSRFSRIDRDSSSDEDEESDSADNEIEKYRQTYFDANDEDSQNTDQQSEASREDEDHPNGENVENSSDVKANNESNSDSGANVPVEESSGYETISTGEVLIREKKDQLYLSTSESCDKMVLRNKKRLSEQDREVDVKRLTRESNRLSSEKSNENNLIIDKTEQEQRTESGQDNKTMSSKTDSKVKERKKILFNKEDFEEDANDDSRITRRTRKSSNMIECSLDSGRSPDSSSNQQRLKSRVKVVNKSNVVKLISDNRDDDEAEQSRTSTKKLRSLVVRK